jgi:hypothetical protein
MNDTLRQSQSVKALLADYGPGEYFCEMLGRRGLAHTREIRKRLACMFGHLTTGAPMFEGPTQNHLEVILQP